MEKRKQETIKIEIKTESGETVWKSVFLKQ